MKNQYNTTIAAISTAMSNSGIGIVRMSGSDSFEIADKIYKGKRDKKLSDQKSHTIHYGYIMDCEDTVDEVLVMLMRGPHSYTGEDTVEINCHGGVYIVKRILEILIKNGARPAEPGEFTKRAFLNGRIDLSQAEAVGDLIVSQNEYALQSSLHQLKGNLKEKISNIADYKFKKKTVSEYFDGSKYEILLVDDNALNLVDLLNKYIKSLLIKN